MGAALSMLYVLSHLKILKDLIFARDKYLGKLGKIGNANMKRDCFVNFKVHTHNFLISIPNDSL